MTRAISRDSFDELKQYVGVHLQQGRVLLDSDWNEGQDIMAALARRVGQDALQDGVLHDGFEIQPVIPAPWGEFRRFQLNHALAGLPFLLQFPSVAPLDVFDSTAGWALTGSAGNLRISRDQPYEGKTFLRLSGHTGTVQLTRTLPAPIDLSAFQHLHFRIRMNRQLEDPPGTSFFIEDSAGKRNVWQLPTLPNAKDAWIPCAALPLDLRFSIYDLELPPAFQGQRYEAMVLSVGASATPVTWAVSAGSLPDGLSLQTQFDSRNAHIVGTPTAVVDRTFTITATSASISTSRTFTMHVQAAPTFPGHPPARVGFDGEAEFFWDSVRARATRTGSPPTGANLSSITKYGFEVFQVSSQPVTWDFDALYPGSRQIVNSVAANNFVISGPLEKQNLILRQSFSQLVGSGFSNNVVDPVLPRAYVGGIACAQPRDMLYSEQADPDDPPLVAPTSGVRTDAVYLDVWREPVTYVEDPALREIALGGPDTSTRMRVRQRVRVAQGGTLPTGNGTGLGTLSTEGSYTGRSNRLYLVEVDTAGDIGAATVRWSEDNGSTIQPVIETIPPSSTTVKVEDGSAFQPGDFILLRKEFQEEEHRIAGVFGNRITLQEPTGPSTTFALADRPKVQRWNRFRAPIVADANDSTLSAPIDLSFGVKVRLGGKELRRGDFWTFRTRHLAGDAASNIAPANRIESLEFQRPHGVIHHYMPLALILREAAAQDPDRVKIIHDRRPRAGHVVCHGPFRRNTEQTGEIPVPLFDIALGATSSESRFLSIWNLSFNTNVLGAGFRISITLNNELDDGGTASFDALIFRATTTEPEGREVAKILNSGIDSVFPANPRSRMSATVQSFTPGATFNIGVELTLVELRNHLENTNRFF